MNRNKAYKLRSAIVQAADSLPVETAVEVPELYQKWKAGETFVLDEANQVPFVIRNYNDVLYRLVQVHTTQEDWTPDLYPALWALYIPAGVIVAWNYNNWMSYTVGVLVSHLGKVYECINASFGWIEPGSQDGHYGWTYKYDL